MIEPVKKRKHLFTSRKKSLKSLMGDSLGVIATGFTAFTLYLTFRNNGTATLQYGAVFLLCTVMALAGEVLSILSRLEPDAYYLFSYIGMVLNGIQLVLAAVVLYYGIM